MTAENGIGNKETETEFENVVTKLMSVDGDSGICYVGPLK